MSTSTSSQADDLLTWLKTAIRVGGHGSQKAAAETLGISQSGLSHLIRRKSIDEKTVRLMSWILSSKWDPIDPRPVLQQTRVDAWNWRLLQNQDGSTEWTWEAAE